MIKIQFFLKKCLLLFTFILLFTAGGCGKVPVPPGGISSPPPAGTGAKPANPQKCPFYRAQSTIMACYREGGFFKEILPERKKTITSVCLKRAFRVGWRVYIPSPYIPETQSQSGFRWWFVWGNLQAGNPPQASPSLVERQYYQQLSAFKSSINVSRFSNCLGMGYTYPTADDLITASDYLMLQGRITPQAFVNCYQEQLDLYKGQTVCPLQPPSPALPPVPSTI